MLLIVLLLFLFGPQGVQKARQLQKVVQAILAADTNQDFVLTEAEFERLIFRLKAFNIVGQTRIKEAMLRSSIGKSIMSLYRDLEQEILEDQPNESTRNLYPPVDPGMACGETDGSFLYRCMD